MKTETFTDLMGAMQDALEHARGKRDLRTTVLPKAPAPMRALDVKRLRRRVNASQAVFAHCLNVSTQLVQAWEAGRRRPEGAALRLLHIGRTHPAVVFAGVVPMKGETEPVHRATTTVARSSRSVGRRTSGTSPRSRSPKSSAPAR